MLLSQLSHRYSTWTCFKLEKKKSCTHTHTHPGTCIWPVTRWNALEHGENKNTRGNICVNPIQMSIVIVLSINKNDLNAFRVCVKIRRKSLAFRSDWLRTPNWSMDVSRSPLSPRNCTPSVSRWAQAPTPAAAETLLRCLRLCWILPAPSPVFRFP